MHIEPIAEKVVYTEQEPIAQEPDKKHVLQQPQEEQQYVEEQPGYNYVPEATVELTADPNDQGRHLKHLTYANCVSQ